MDAYDRWKLETPEEEDERLNGRFRRNQARLEYLADHVDYLLEDERERERDNASTNHEVF